MSAPSSSRNVGAVRRAGFAALVDRHGAAGHWLCTSDADSEVPARWLVGQLAAARQSWDALVGTVTVADWAGYPARLRRRYRRAYSSQWGHPHVHGANLGVRARSYLDVDGMPPLPSGEDTALVAALAAAGCRILRTPRTPVRTSARRRGRATAGFAAHLATLGDDQRATG